MRHLSINEQARHVLHSTTSCLLPMDYVYIEMRTTIYVMQETRRLCIRPSSTELSFVSIAMASLLRIMAFIEVIRLVCPSPRIHSPYCQYGLTVATLLKSGIIWGSTMRTVSSMDANWSPCAENLSDAQCWLCCTVNGALWPLCLGHREGEHNARLLAIRTVTL